MTTDRQPPTTHAESFMPHTPLPGRLLLALAAGVYLGAGVALVWWWLAVANEGMSP